MDERELTKRHAFWAVALIVLGLAWSAGVTYCDMLYSRERQLCISSGGEPGPEHKCARFTKDK